MKWSDEIKIEQGHINADPTTLYGNRDILFKTFMIINLEIQIKNEQLPRKSHITKMDLKIKRLINMYLISTEFVIINLEMKKTLDPENFNNELYEVL